MNENSFLSFAMLFSAALVFFINYLKRKKAIVRSKFPTASGIIHDVHLKEYRDSRYDDDTGQSETRITYHPHIKYKYEIEGKIYEGNRIHVLDKKSFTHKDEGEKYISSYKVGDNVLVYYDPAKPSFSFLDNQVRKNILDLGSIIIISVLTILAIYLFLSSK